MSCPTTLLLALPPYTVLRGRQDQISLIKESLMPACRTAKNLSAIPALATLRPLWPSSLHLLPGLRGNKQPEPIARGFALTEHHFHYICTACEQTIDGQAVALRGCTARTGSGRCFSEHGSSGNTQLSLWVHQGTATGARCAQAQVAEFPPVKIAHSIFQTNAGGQKCLAENRLDIPLTS